jgi:glycosyltransferase involved in cell wall biosynthesis
MNTRKLNIALTADPELPVPPLLYGGIERIIDLLAVGLAERGHNVTLFAHSDSNSSGQLIKWPGKNSRSKWDTIQNSVTLWKHVTKLKPDILHSFSRIAYLAPALGGKTPKIMSYQREISTATTKLAFKLSRGSLDFTALSDWMIQPVKDIGRWHKIPNGVDTGLYDFVPTVAQDAPLVFLGRIEEIKGPHLAIEIAKRTGKRLIIAGNIPDAKRVWAEQYVLQHVDGQQITYIGPVNDAQKNKLLGSASGFLMPILWEEPFGIVMAEALACGTPVIGMNRGAVSEVVVHGVSGIVRDTVDELVTDIKANFKIDRKACRDRAQTYYSKQVIVDQYESLYFEILDRKSHKNIV